MGANGSCECFGGGAAPDRPKSSLNPRVELENKNLEDSTGKPKVPKYQPLGNEKETSGPSGGRSSNLPFTATRPKAKSRGPKKLELSDFMMLRVIKFHQYQHSS